MRRLGQLAILLAVFAGVAPRVFAQTHGQATAPAVDSVPVRITTHSRPLRLVM